MSLDHDAMMKAVLVAGGFVAWRNGPQLPRTRPLHKFFLFASLNSLTWIGGDVPEFLKAIPDAASSPFAIFAYVVAAIVLFFGGRSIRQLKIVAKIVRHKNASTPEQLAELREAIKVATGTVLPDTISPQDYLASQKHQGIILVSISAMLLISVVAIIALTKTHEENEMSIHVRVRNLDGDAVKDGIVVLYSFHLPLDKYGEANFDHIAVSRRGKQTPVEFLGNEQYLPRTMTFELSEEVTLQVDPRRTSCAGSSCIPNSGGPAI